MQGGPLGAEPDPLPDFGLATGAVLLAVGAAAPLGAVDAVAAAGARPTDGLVDGVTGAADAGAASGPTAGATISTAVISGMSERSRDMTLLGIG